MHDVFDRLENRSAASRESALFRDLQHVLHVSKSRAPALRGQLKGIDVSKLRTRADLRMVPLRRRADLVATQTDAPPLGGYLATRLAGLAHVGLVSSGADALATPCGLAKDWWGLGRGFYAAGLRKGALVLNAYPYDLLPHGHMADAGARAIGCPVLPAGGAEPKRIAEAAARFRPTFFCGAADRLRATLDAGVELGLDMSSIDRAFVTGVMKLGLRRELELRKVALRHALVLPEIGLVAFECGTNEGMTLAECLVLEVVDPTSGQPVEPGAEGEMVLSRINLDFPLLRYATGVFVRTLAEPSGCGRTNTRIMPIAEATRSGDSDTLRAIRARHPDLRMRLSFSAGMPHLIVEHRQDEPALRAYLRETLASVTRRSGVVEIVRPGTLRDDETGAPGVAPP